jgi:hypothetical protein
VQQPSTENITVDCEDDMSAIWEPATRKEIRAFRLPSNHVLVTARGENPTPGFAVDLEQSLIKIFPPQFVLRRRRLPGIFPQVVTPYRHSEIVSYPAEQDTIRIHHAEGFDDQVIEELDERTARFTSTVSSNYQTAPEGSDEATGFSANLRFDEAFADALANLPEPKEPVADQLQRIEVQETGALIGGIVGFHHLFVRVSRTLS